MPKYCAGSYAKVKPFECDLNGTVNCPTCGSEGLSTIRTVTSDGKTELLAEQHAPLPRTFLVHRSLVKKYKRRDYPRH
jgi:hypothetical protein